MDEDDGLKFTESFESLWFFGNVLSSKTTVLGFGFGFGKPDKPIPNPVIVGGFKKPICSISQDQQNESPIVENSADQMMGGESGFVSVIGAEPEYPKKATDEEEKKRKRSRRSRKMIGEMDLRFAVKKVSEHWLTEQKRNGNGYERNRKWGEIQNYKFPPFDDRNAMEEHIKSWAYAVAYTVR